MSTIAASSELSILSRVIDPEHGDFPAAAAAAILQLDFDPHDRQRMHELVQRNQSDSLTPDEQDELENYCNVGRLLDLFRSKARQSLQKSDNGS